MVESLFLTEIVAFRRTSYAAVPFRFSFRFAGWKAGTTTCCKGPRRELFNSEHSLPEP
jgi:hypothetical protein